MAAERSSGRRKPRIPQRVRPHHRGLLLIGLFKLSKSIFFFLMGLGALHFLHRDLSDAVMRLATAMRFDPEGRLVGLLLEKVDLIDAHRLRLIGVATFAYSALALTEGVGLMLEKTWAEYLTLGITIAFIPWELYELVFHASLFRLGLLLINIGVLCYLLWWLGSKRKASEDAQDRTDRTSRALAAAQRPHET